MAKKKSKKPVDKSLSLYPIEFQFAMEDILKVKPKKKVKKK